MWGIIVLYAARPFARRHPQLSIASPSPWPMSITIHLQFLRGVVIDVVTAVNHRRRRKHHDIDYRRNRNRPSPGGQRAAEGHEKGHRRETCGQSCAQEGEAGQEGHPAKKAPKRAKKATGARDGSKTATILEMLKRTGGATATELLKTTGWQPHSLRGFISGTLGKKLGLTVTSLKSEDGERTYSVKA